MKRLIAVIAVLSATTWTWAAGPELITVKAVKKTADTRHGTGASRPRVNVQTEAKDVFYQFDLTTMAPDMPTNVVVKWVVALENAQGRVRVATRGKQDVKLPKGRPVRIETDDFTLFSKEVRRRGRVAESEAQVYGYGLRVCDEQGHQLFEKIDPERAARKIQDAFDGKLREAEAK